MRAMRGAILGPILILLALMGGAGVWWMAANTPPADATPVLALRGEPIRKAPVVSKAPVKSQAQADASKPAVGEQPAEPEELGEVANATPAPTPDVVPVLTPFVSTIPNPPPPPPPPVGTVAAASEPEESAPDEIAAPEPTRPAPHFATSFAAPNDSGVDDPAPDPGKAVDPADDSLLNVSFLDLYLNDFVPPDPGRALPADREPTPFPDPVRALHGRRITIEGFMVPSTFEGDVVSEFILSGDPPGCCFGGIPAFDQWIEVKMAADADKPEYDPFVMYTVTGRLAVGEVINEYELLDSLYRMSGEAVSADW